ncbi:hypothetical protein F511_46008 [Dorcoceras hygrometricum]|uniref:Uncharacterized protein n=1 Tax=Dorcoceras hygrometricum TaxID=472368 RepID=A0A2Z7A1Y7_9LAMI|nr:hypothetical protein F511_46008 [Dorcoceras hygrometricum]
MGGGAPPDAMAACARAASRIARNILACWSTLPARCCARWPDAGRSIARSSRDGRAGRAWIGDRLGAASRELSRTSALLRAMDAADLRDRRVLLAGRCALEGTRSPLASPVVAPPVGASRRNCGALVARKIHDGGGRRPVAAPASFRRCRDGWSDFF